MDDKANGESPSLVAEVFTEKEQQQHGKLPYKFVHTFGYHTRPKPASIPKRIRVAAKNRVIQCAEQLEFNYTQYFSAGGDDLWIDPEDDDERKLLTPVVKPPSQILPLFDFSSTKQNPPTTATNEQLQTTIARDTIKIAPKNLPIFNVVEDLKSLGILESDPDPATKNNDIFFDMVEEEFSNKMPDGCDSQASSSQIDQSLKNCIYESIPWENELIPFNNSGSINEVKNNMIDVLRAGWIPTTDIRTWKDFITHQFQNNSLDHETLLLLLNVLSSLKMASDHPDGSYSVKDWYNILIDSYGNNYENDIYSLPTYITRHLISFQNPAYNQQLSIVSNVRDFMNVSNDSYYLEGKNTQEEDIFDESALNIKHAYPTEIMHRTLMPIYLDCVEARNFHRPILTPLAYGPLSKSGYRAVRNLQSHIKKKSKDMQKKRKLSGYSDISFMQTLDDISSTDGHLILVEYSEEFPPFLCQNGMNSVLIQFSRVLREKASNVSTSYDNHRPSSPPLTTTSNTSSNRPIQHQDQRNISSSASGSKRQQPNVGFKTAAHTSSTTPNSRPNRPSTMASSSSCGDRSGSKLLSSGNAEAKKKGGGAHIGENKPKFGEYGKPMYVDKVSPFLGNLSASQVVLAIENNLYRAPLYRHEIPKTDFLIIRNSGGYFIREFQSVMLAGQQIPKRVIPVPGSKASSKYNRDLLQVYIYRYFHRSKEVPPRLKTDEIRRLFKHNSENAIRKRLKYCSDYKRNSSIPGEIGSWHLRDSFNLPSFDEMTRLCRPEDACVYFGMVSAERRLKDLGYDKKVYSVHDNGDDDIMEALRGEDEILSAPWNTTSAYMDAVRGKCVLDVSDGPADPSPNHTAFSYSKLDSRSDSFAPAEAHNSNTSSSKSTSMNQTDLRKINMKVAKKYLISFGLNAKKVEEMTRWEVVDAIKKFVQDDKNLPSMFLKYTRTTKILTPQTIQRFKKCCQKQFEMQNRNLSSSEVSKQQSSATNGAESENENFDNEQLGKDLEGFLNDIQIYGSSEDSNDEEDLNSISDSTGAAGSKLNSDTNLTKISKNIPSKLVIKRVFNDGAKTYERTEILTNPRIISAYLKTIRKNKTLEAKIKVISKPKARPTKKTALNISRLDFRVDPHLRSSLKAKSYSGTGTIKSKNDALPPRSSTKNVSSNTSLLDAVPAPSSTTIANRQTTNVSCETQQQPNSPSFSAASLKHQSIQDEPKKSANVKIEGTKLYIDKSLLQLSKDKKKMSQQSRKLKEDSILGGCASGGGRKRKLSDTYDYYFYKPFKSHGRRRVNPQVSLNAIFESVLGELKKNEETWPFHQPVSSKLVVDYYKVIKDPMDLQTLKDLTSKHTFTNRKEFLEKLGLIEKNCVLYNGIKSPLSATARALVEQAQSLINEKDEEIFAFEKEINPLLDEDAQIPLSWIFENIINKVKALGESFPFLQPVSLKLFPNYLDYVSCPMDLSLLKSNCHNHKYSNVDSFMYDVRLLYENSVKFNGDNHNVTQFANKVIQCVEEELQKVNEHIQNLQDEIASQPAHLKKFYEESRQSIAGIHHRKVKKNLTHNLKDKLNVSADAEGFDVLKDLEMSDEDDDDDND